MPSNEHDYHEKSDTRLQRVMDDQYKMQVVHEERLTKVESRLTTVEVQLPFLQSAISKLTEIADRQERQGTLNEAAIVAMRERTDQFAAHMEKAADRLTERQEKTTERLDKLESERISMLEGRVGRQDTKWTALQAVAVAAVGVAVTMLFQHLATLIR